MALQRLKEAAEKAKKDLSFQAQADINLPFISVKDTVPLHLTMTISRSQFERLTDALFDRCKAPVLKALDDAKLKANQIDEVVLVGGSTRMPRVQQIVKEIFGKEPHKGVNPDEVVAVGAAIQGAVLTGEVKDLLLLDVTPLSLGLETKGGVFTKLVERNTTIPTEKKETFTTAEDNQSAVTIKVYQGERPMAADNRLLGEFNLEGIPPARMGTPQIEVAFNLDANGILNVTARDKGTGKEHTIKIESSGGLTKDEIERMQRDAESHAAEDKRKRDLAEARNTAEQRVYQLEKLLDENKDKLKESDVAAVRAAIEKVNEAKKGDDVARLQQSIDDLQRASQAMSEHLYAGAGAPPGAGAGPEGHAASGPDGGHGANGGSTSSSKKRSDRHNRRGGEDVLTPLFYFRPPPLSRNRLNERDRSRGVRGGHPPRPGLEEPSQCLSIALGPFTRSSSAWPRNSPWRPANVVRHDGSRTMTSASVARKSG
jgi:molecular chaperone DnaK